MLLAKSEYRYRDLCYGITHKNIRKDTNTSNDIIRISETKKENRYVNIKQSEFKT